MNGALASWTISRAGTLWDGDNLGYLCYPSSMPRGIYLRPPRKPPLLRKIRTLRSGEPFPTSEPRRYPDRAGYIRLRWKVGPGEYVEIREHRAVRAGDESDHVHHINHNPADNRLENLVRLSKHEHAAIHGGKSRKFNRRRAAQLYEAGLSTPELGRVFGVNAASIYRALRAEGVALRNIGESKRTPIDEDRVIALHDAGWKAGTIGRELGVGREVVARVLRDHGRKPHGPGRPPAHS